jgi:hypothetical protein
MATTEGDDLVILKRSALRKGAAKTGDLSNVLPLVELGADPAAPAANNGVVYLRDNGAGKTQLCVRFATGAVQVIATQP